MPLRSLMSLAVLFPALLLVVSGCARPALDRPNVLVVVVDTLRADHLPFYGYEVNSAPFLAEWAPRSIVFDNAWSTSSWTAPATASLFTGVYPVQHGVHLGIKAHELLQRGGAVQQRGGAKVTLDRVPDALETLPEFFRSQGYRTFGVSDNPNVSDAQGFAAGFDRFANFSYAGADRVNEAIASWDAERKSAEPWFVYLHYMDPHEPYNARRPWLRRPATNDVRDVKAAAYDSEIGWVDEHLRAVFEQLGVDDSTLVVFVADHGEEFGDHGGTSHRFKLYSELMRVPFFLYLPGIAPRRVEADVSLVDLLPTLRSFLALPASEQDAGVDLTQVDSIDDGVEPDRAVFASRTTGLAWKHAIVRGRYKLIATRPGGNELYDLESDPGEQHDLSGELPELLEELLQESNRMRSSARRWEQKSITREVSDEELRRLGELGYVEDDGN